MEIKKLKTDKLEIRQINSNFSKKDYYKRENPLSRPSAYTLTEIFEELKFGRPAESQQYLQECIDFLAKSGSDISKIKKYNSKKTEDLIIQKDKLERKLNELKRKIKENELDDKLELIKESIEDECPLNNLIDRLKIQYPKIYNKLDLNIDFGDKVPNIFQQYSHSFFNEYKAVLNVWYSKNDTFYYILEHKGNVYNSNEMGFNFEFEMTAQMACIEKAFEILNNINN